MKNTKRKLLSLFLALVMTIVSNMAFADDKIEVQINTEENDKTAIEILYDYMTDKKDKLYLASSDVVADGITGGILASLNSGVLSFAEYIESENDLEEFKSVSFLGGSHYVKSTAAENSPKFSERIYGKDRYETAVKIAEKLGTERNIIFVNAHRYADAVTATALAKKLNYSLLSVDKDNIPDSTLAYLKEHGLGKDVLFVGGEVCLSEKVKSEILNLVGKNDSDTSKYTLAGANRYETSLKVAEKFGGYSKPVFADGENYKMAVVGSIVAAKQDSPLILIRNDNNFSLDQVTKNQNISKMVFVKSLNDQEMLNLKSEFSGNINFKDLKANQIIVNEVKKDVLAARVLSSSEVGRDLNSKVTNIDTENKLIQLNDGSSVRYTRAIRMRSTAYDPSVGEWTASGTRARLGAVAVDPNFISLGTKLYIQSTDDWKDYGFSTAEDTGGAIKGDIVDVFLSSEQESINYGRRDVIVYILD